MSYGLVFQLVFENLLCEGRTPKACLAHPKPATSPGSSFEDASRETQKHAKPSSVKSKKRKNAVKPFDKYFSFVFLFSYSLFLALFIFFFICQSRTLPDTPEELIEYFLDTEAQEIEFEIARMRPRFVLYL